MLQIPSSNKKSDDDDDDDSNNCSFQRRILVLMRFDSPIKSITRTRSPKAIVKQKIVTVYVLITD